MRLGHFHGLRPVCPACRKAGRWSALSLGTIDEERHDDVRSGVLHCEACGQFYPIIDGLPILVPDLNRFLTDNLFYLTMRRDLSPTVGALLADATGPGSGLDAIRQHVSSYGWDHWADKDPQEAGVELVEPGQVARLLRRLLDGRPEEALPDGPILDVGCGAGRTVGELAERLGRLTLGVDLSVPLARVARNAVVDGVVVYDRRRSGLSFEMRHFPVAPNPSADIWIADALALPFAPDSLAFLTALNLLDCVSDPRAVLAEFGRVLKPGAPCALATPFDWSAAATPFDNWLGGRALTAGPGSASQMLAAFLTEGPQAAGALRQTRPAEDAEWHLRLHDRSAMRYLTHLSWSARPLRDLAA